MKIVASAISRFPICHVGQIVPIVVGNSMGSIGYSLEWLVSRMLFFIYPTVLCGFPGYFLASPSGEFLCPGLSTLQSSKPSKSNGGGVLLFGGCRGRFFLNFPCSLCHYLSGKQVNVCGSFSLFHTSSIPKRSSMVKRKDFQTDPLPPQKDLPTFTFEWVMRTPKYTWDWKGVLDRRGRDLGRG
jgi:hypothetical protein